MFERLDQIESRYEELTNALASPDIVNDSARYQKTAKAHAEIAPVVEEVDGFGAIDPPNGRRIGAGGQANVLNLPRAVDDGDGPEDDAVSLLVQAIGEAKKLDVEIGRVKSMPREFPVANLHLVAVVRNDGELVGEVLGIKSVPDVAVGKHGVG